VTVVWHAQDGEVVASFKTESEGKGTWDCKFISEDKLVTVCDDGHLRCWLIAKGRCTLDLSIHTERIRRFDISSDGRIVSYNLRDKRILAECFVGSRVWSIDVLQDLGYLISVAEDGILRIHARENLALLHQSKMLDGHLMACAKHPRQQDVCFVGDGSRLTTVSFAY
jgi:WD40 repeat protein